MELDADGKEQKKQRLKPCHWLQPLLSFLRCNVFVLLLRLLRRYRIEVNHPRYGLPTDWTEHRVLVCAHTAIGESAVHPMHGISCGLVGSHLPLLHIGLRSVEVLGLRCGQFGAFLDEVLPFVVEVDKRGEVRFPWFNVVRVHWNLLHVVSIFVAETGERVAELMYYDGLEGPVVSHREVVGVVYSPAAILVRVDKDDDVLVWCARQPVVKILQMERRQVALRVECVEIGVQCCVLPYSLRRYRRAAVVRRCLYGNDVEPVAQALEGFVGKERVHGRVAVGNELRHLLLGIPFGYVGNVYAVGGVACLLEGDVGRYALLADAPDEYVAGHYGVGKTCCHLPAVVAQVDGNVDSVLREWYEEYVLERFCLRLGLRIGEPFLEEGGEGVAVDDFVAVVVADGYLSVALHGNLTEPLPLAVPSWNARQFVDGNVLFGAVAREDIIDSERGIGKELVEILSYCRKRREGKGYDKE